MEEIILRYFHYIGIMVVTASLFAQHLFIKSEMPREEIIRISRINLFYVLAVIVVFITGLTLWLWIGKPAVFYTKNFLFHIKLTLFFILVFLSIYPTLFFRKNKKSKLTTIKISKPILILLHIELFIIFIIPLLAVLMSRGIGMY